MAEFAGTIISIGVAAGSAIKLAKTLYRFCKSVRGATDDILCFAKDVEAYGTVIRFAHLSLDRHFGSAGAQSPVLNFMDTQNVLRQLKHQADRVKDHIKQLLKRIKPFRNKSEWWTRIKWFLQKPDFEAVAPKMESVKSSLNVVVTFVMMEVMLQQERAEPSDEVRDGLRKQIKQLKRQVKAQMKTIQYFQQLELRRAPLEQRHGSGQPLVSPVYEMQTALVDLGESMVRNETVPSVSSRSSSSVSSSSRRVVYHNNSRKLPVVRGRSSPAPRVVPSSPPITPPPTSLAVESGPLLGGATREASVYSSASTPSQPGASSQEVVREVRDPSPVAGPSEVRETSISAHLSPQSEGDYVGVYPSSQQIHVRRRNHYRHVSGFITTASGPVPTEAALLPNIEECIISRSFAMEFGLEILRLDDVERDALIIWQDGAREVTTEQVRIEWTETGNVVRPFRVRCLVSRRDGLLSRTTWRVMFGTPFVEKRRHYMEGNASVL